MFVRPPDFPGRDPEFDTEPVREGFRGDGDEFLDVPFPGRVDKCWISHKTIVFPYLFLRMSCIKGGLLQIRLKGRGRDDRGMLATCLPRPSSLRRIIGTPFSGRSKEAGGRRQTLSLAAAGALSPVSGAEGLGPRLRPAVLRGLPPAALDGQVPMPGLPGGPYLEAVRLLAEVPLLDPDDPSGSSA